MIPLTATSLVPAKDIPTTSAISTRRFEFLAERRIPVQRIFMAPKSRDSSKSRDTSKSRDPSKDKPTLRFLTRSHPDDFKDDQARQDVRSHVMRDYRRKSSPMTAGRKPSRSRSKAGASTEARSSQQPPVRSMSNTTSETSSPTELAAQFESSWPIEFEWNEAEPYMAPLGCAHVDRPRVDLCSNDDGVGPFPIPSHMPPFMRSATLCYPCITDLSATRTSSSLAPADLATTNAPSQERVSLLASLLSEVARTDLILNSSGKSQQSLDMQADIIQILNENLGDVDAAFQDGTVFGVLDLIISEAMQDNDAVREVHTNGFISIVARQGGLSGLIPENEMMLIGSEQLLLMSAIFELDPPSIHREDSRLHIVDLPWATSAALPSPLLLELHSDMVAWSNYPDYLLSMLRRMRELTLRFLTEQQQGGADDGDESSARRARAYWYELAQQPCMTPASTRSAEEWVYEACRLAGLIYCTALIEQVSIPVAAALASTRLKTPMMLEMLCSALYQTPLASLWGDLAGAYVWVTLIGAAAVNGSEEAREQSPALLRRWLQYAAICCLNILKLPQAATFSSSLRTMLRVQRMLRLHEQRSQE